MMFKVKFIHLNFSILVFFFLYSTGLFINTVGQVGTNDVTLSSSDEIKSNFSIKYSTHEPIRINGTTHFRRTVEIENWRGDGSRKNPYLIDGLKIMNSGNLISIYHTDLHFQIIDCFLSGLYSSSFGCGILLSNVTNSYIRNNVIENINGIGIYIEKSFKSIITENSIQINNKEGILIEESQNIDIFENKIVGNGFVGIDLYRSMHINITLNQVHSNPLYGVRLKFSNNNLLYRTSISNNSGYGICFEDSNNNNIFWNTFIKNNQGGSSQGYDNGIGNSIANNFWNEWLNPDDNDDGIVDFPYELDGFSNNLDEFPHISLQKTLFLMTYPADNNDNCRIIKPETNTDFGMFFMIVVLILLGNAIRNQKKRGN